MSLLYLRTNTPPYIHRFTSHHIIYIAYHDSPSHTCKWMNNKCKKLHHVHLQIPVHYLTNIYKQLLRNNYPANLTNFQTANKVAPPGLSGLWSATPRWALRREEVEQVTNLSVSEVRKRLISLQETEKITLLRSISFVSQDLIIKVLQLLNHINL